MIKPRRTSPEKAPHLEAAGFPSPAGDYLDMGISLDRSLIENPEATFFFRVSGSALQDLGIFEGDLLVVDRSLPPRSEHIVVAVSDGEFVIRRVRELRADSGGEIIVWGVIRWAIHRLCPLR